MKGDKEIIGLLEQALQMEITAIFAYFLHAEMLADWGVKKLAALEKKASIDEMHHAEWLIEHILFLEGRPTMKTHQEAKPGADVKGIIEFDLNLEYDARKFYNESIATCGAKKDNGSKAIFERLLAEEEEHIDFLETQLDLIKQIGIENYIVAMSEGPKS
ncbi:MAG: bacterioferritin [Deltaproteobacteria bacterium]|nr:bacterioferritin [Deltaproteobacteria bacterium]MCB9490279.1 bacterioferritin [Deltaproteobacteria bacterium]